MQTSIKRSLKGRSKVWNNYEDVASANEANRISRHAAKINLKKYPKLIDKRHVIV